MSTTWTEQDEATLRELTERKMRFTDEAKEPLREVILKTTLSVNTHVGPQTQRVLDELVKHAAELRDALAPFDLRDALAPFDLRKPAPDPVEAAIQSGSFRFFDSRHVAMGECSTNRVAPNQWQRFRSDGTKIKGFLTEQYVRELLRESMWRLAE